jgi:hypothetical protein
MSKNMGTTDRAIRGIAGVVVAALALAGLITGVWMWVAYIVAAVLIVTALAGFCPVYRIFGWSTGPRPAAAA